MLSAPNGLRASSISRRIRKGKTTREGQFGDGFDIFGGLRQKTDFRVYCRVRILREETYTQKDAEAAVGLGVDNGTRSQGLASSMDMDDSNQS